MKTTLLILCFITWLYYTSGMAKVSHGCHNSIFTQTDTSAVLQKTDSLTASMLETWDENSGRQTGVPLSLEHYNRNIYDAQGNNAVNVNYCFNKTKKFGTNRKNIDFPGENHFPYKFVIVYEKDTNIVFVLPSE
jgi:hypothetical protein